MSEFPFDDFKETDFNEFERFFKTNTVNPIYDHRANFQTNSPSFYEYLAKHNHLIKILAKRIYDYDKELAKRFEEWDKRIENLPDELKRMFLEWVDDGTLARILAQLLLDDYATKEEVNDLIEVLENELNLKIEMNEDDISILFKRTIGMKSAMELGALDDDKDQSEVFNSIEETYEGLPIDLAGKKYVVDKFPTNNFYIDGTFIINGKEYGSGYISHIQAGNPNVFLGRNSGENFTPDLTYFNTTGGGHNLTAVGNESLKNASENTRNSTAFGSQALKNSERGGYNVAVGYACLRDVNGVLGQNFSGTRNVGVGDHAMMMLTTGYSNVAMGRNALQVSSTGIYNTAIGTGAMSGYAPLDLDGKTVTTFHKGIKSNQTAVGTESLMFSDAEGNTALGARTGRLIKSGERNTAIGYETLRTLEKNSSNDNREVIEVNKTGTYSLDGKTLNIVITNHGCKFGDTVLIGINGNEPSYYNVSSVLSSNEFTIVSRVDLSNINKNGSVKITEFIKYGTNVKSSNDNTAVGVRSMYLSEKGDYNTGVGGFTLSKSNGEGNSALGYLALTNLVNGNYNTAIGYNALRFDSNDQPFNNFENITGIGFDSKASGSDQIQLGNEHVNVYAYSPVQTRSDKRDKKDITETKLGLDFINLLKPVDYKTKYGKRVHHGLIAQDLIKLKETHGIEFGGLQDHSINGGNDVLTVAYTELISPLIKSVQELSTEVNHLKQEIQELKGV